MIEEKKSGLSVFIAPTKTVGDVVVSICFPLNANGCVLSKLNAGGGGCNSTCFPSGSEEACIGFSLYLTIRQALCGNALAVSKTKVGEVKCGAHDGMFFINWKVKGTVSAARKSIGIALKCLNPARMGSTYTRCVRLVGGKPTKEAFAYVVDETAKSINKDLVIGIVGNIKADKAKLKDLVDTVSKKVDASSVSGSKSKPTDHTSCDHADYTELKISGWSSAILSDYIQFKAKGVVPSLYNKYLLLPMKTSQWDTLSKKIKKGVKDFVSAKYAKVSVDLPEVLGYYVLSSGMLCAGDVRTMLNSGVTSSALESAINKYL
jgi:hypothetical protein